MWRSAQLLSGCHIPRWHVVTGPSEHACCQKQTDPLHSEGSRSKLGPSRPDGTLIAQPGVSGGFRGTWCSVRGPRTRCSHHREGNAPPHILSDALG